MEVSAYRDADEYTEAGNEKAFAALIGGLLQSPMREQRSALPRTGESAREAIDKNPLPQRRRTNRF